MPKAPPAGGLCLAGLAMCAMACVAPQPRRPPVDDVWRMRLTQGDRALHHGRYDEAETALTAALQETGAFGPGDSRSAENLNDLGDLNLARGRYDKAEVFYRRALAADRTVFGSGSVQEGTDLLYLADLKTLQGQADEARRLYETGSRALARHGRKTDLAARLNEMALLYQAQGRTSEAEKAHKRALELTERALGPDHRLVASRLDDLAMLYQSLGRYADAEPLYTRELAILEKNHSEDLDRFFNDLALFYEAQGREGPAEEFYRKALAWTQSTYGRSSRRLAPTLENYASLLRRLGRTAEAEPLEARARVLTARRTRGRP